MIEYVDEYRDEEICMDLSGKIRAVSRRRFNIMEVCGGHTMSIRKNGIQKLIGENINLMSGPGCPVCVTSINDIDRIIALARVKGNVICTFGDLFYVPGTDSSLADEKARGGDIRMVYSAHDVLDFAGEEPEKKFIFVSIGFETTAPTSAASVIEAGKRETDNFYLLPLNKTMPAALREMVRRKDSNIDALICPGHVSTITGTGIYRPIVEDFKVSCCISGFEPVDLLSTIYLLADLHEKEEVSLINNYKRAVREDGNGKALHILYEVFEPSDTVWRGIGNIPGSGLGIRDKYARFDAVKMFDIDVPVSVEDPDCICGEILTGVKKPSDCALFGTACTPVNPRGACMVSSEGTCSAWYKYGE